MSSARRKNKILIIDDDVIFASAFKKIFDRNEFDLISAVNGRDGLTMIEHEDPSIVFMDVSMPIMDGLDVLLALKEKNIDLPIVIMTGNSTMDTAIKATQLGAYEYITKPIDVNKVRVIARHALETAKLRREVNVLRSEANFDPGQYELIGSSAAMQDVFKIIGTITATPNTTNVLILGPSGTGKELAARAIHSRGATSADPFVAINCTALPEALLESELFGHEKGSFTGAVGQKIGKFELAGNGTIFLDEIGDMPPILQQKLLRVIQEREFERVGSNKSLKVGARFIAATNQNLEDRISDGSFREDLYYRLKVMTVSMPPLCDHKEDISDLVGHFISKYNAQLGRGIVGVDDNVRSILDHYDFPGNVRELDNLIERCIIMSRSDVIMESSLPRELVRNQTNTEYDLDTLVLEDARRSAVESVERRIIVENLKSSDGNVTLAARQAKVARESFHRLMKKYDVRADDYRP